eukprot:1467269-Amphidinium_carterae.1
MDRKAIIVGLCLYSVHPSGNKSILPSTFSSLATTGMNLSRIKLMHELVVLKLEVGVVLRTMSNRSMNLLLEVAVGVAYVMLEVEIDAAFVDVELEV